MIDGITGKIRGERWKGKLLLPETPRLGDTAVIVRNHGCGPDAQESGAFVRVTDNPVFLAVTCEHCGAEIAGWVVEVEPLDDIGDPIPGQRLYAYPVAWLQRVLPLGHADASQKTILI